MATRPADDQRPVLKMAQDEGRFGRISMPKRAWALPGVRPKVARQVVLESSYVYAALAPEEGLMTSLILPSANTAMMNLFLAQVSQDAGGLLYCDASGSSRLAPGQRSRGA